MIDLAAGSASAATTAQLVVAALGVAVVAVVAALGAAVKYGRTTQGLTTMVESVTDSIDGLKGDLAIMRTESDATVTRVQLQVEATQKSVVDSFDRLHSQIDTNTERMIARTDGLRESVLASVEEVRRETARLTAVASSGAERLASLDARVEGPRGDLRNDIRELRKDVVGTRDKAVSAETKADLVIEMDRAKHGVDR